MIACLFFARSNRDGLVAEVKFDRTPYKVQYYKDGKKHTIRRIPPPKLHDMLPEDVVTISRKKNDDWDEDMTVKIKDIQRRQPNTLTIENDDGKYTFIDYTDVRFDGRPSEEFFSSEGAARAADPIGSKYLLWP